MLLVYAASITDCNSKSRCNNRLDDSASMGNRPTVTVIARVAISCVMFGTH